MSEEINLTRHEVATLREMGKREWETGWPRLKRACSVSGLIMAGLVRQEARGSRISDWQAFVTPAGRAWLAANKV